MNQIKVRWIKISEKTYAMNVPGGCVIRCDATRSSTFVPSVAAAPAARKGYDATLVSTAEEDLARVMKPIRDLLKMFKGLPGIPDIPDPS